MTLREKLHATLDSLGGARIAVVGDYCLDAYWHLDPDTSERSLETGLPIGRVATQRYSLGGAGNVVANLVALGAGEVRAIGVLGADPFGETVRHLLAALAIDLNGVLDLGGDWQTLVYAKPYVGTLEQERIDFGSRAPLPEKARASLLQNISDAATWAHVMIMNQQTRSCFAEREIVAGIDRIVAEHPTCLFLVDARDAAAAYHGAILKVNAAEAATLLSEPTDIHRPTRAITAMAQQIMRKTGFPVFVTRGERGMVAVDAAGVYDALGVQVLGPVDPVGAGDTVVATIAATVASGGDTESAVHLANLAASITVGKRNMTGSATREAIHRLIDDSDYVYSPDLADMPGLRRYAENTDFELIDNWPSDLHIEHAIFDHDGTLSTLRQGWEDVMAPMMVEAILGNDAEKVDSSSRAEVSRAVADLIDRTTGVQTLLQMDSLVELVAEFGYVPASEIKDGPGYKQDYNQRLMELVEARRKRLTSGELDANDFLIKGSVHLLETLRDRGVTLYLVSGTDLQDVRSEASLLGIAGYFGDHIYGAVGVSRVEMKKLVLERVVQENGLGGRSLVTFGDGPVEVRETRKRGGLAIGVCSDEVRRYGHNEAKRRRLVRGGATLLISDYGAMSSLIPMLFANSREPTASGSGMQRHRTFQESWR